jgi:hypothetical protein
MKLDIKHVRGNDISVDFQCSCPHPSFKGTEVEEIMKRRIHLYGYADNFFFTVVNKEPREFKCGCGKKYSHQWFSEGFVELKELGEWK